VDGRVIGEAKVFPCWFAPRDKNLGFLHMAAGQCLLCHHQARQDREDPPCGLVTWDVR
jgi:hypothetical protein